LLATVRLTDGRGRRSSRGPLSRRRWARRRQPRPSCPISTV